MRTKPVISVVVPTCHRPRLLLRSLDALLTQEGVRGAIEIIVVDDARSVEQETALAVFVRRCARARPIIRYIQPPEGVQGPAAARNAGWRAARSDILAFTDDDTIPAHNWLSAGLRAMRPGVAAAWGDVIVPLPDRPTDAERRTAILDGAEFITANCFVRREALILAGGFDERFVHPWREDSDLYFTLLEGRHKVVSAPEAIVIHPARPAPPGDVIQRHRNLVSEALLFKKHRELYREKIAALPPLSYYLTVVAIALAFVSLALGNTFATVAAAAAWFSLTARLAVTRLRGTSRDLRNVADILLTTPVIPVVAVFWRLAGALRFRVPFA